MSGRHCVYHHHGIVPFHISHKYIVFLILLLVFSFLFIRSYTEDFFGVLHIVYNPFYERIFHMHEFKTTITCFASKSDEGVRIFVPQQNGKKKESQLLNAVRNPSTIKDSRLSTFLRLYETEKKRWHIIDCTRT